MATITDQVGRVLGGRYRLEAGIGTGTSAYVYAATDLVLLRRVAVKVLQPGLDADDGFLRRFRAEAQAAAALDHPHILKVFDWGQDHEGAFLVLEHLAGGSLRDLLDAGVRLDPAQAARIGAEAAHGLAYAHRRGLVHRDVKPANLMLDEDGHVRVADFGLARALAEAAWTEPFGAVLGTARYASPEQAQGYPLDDRSDVYSLALVLYESLVGRVPFSADTTLSTLMARVGANLPRAPELGPLAPILAQAAIPEPVARLDAAELAVELELLRRSLPAAAPLPLRVRDGEPALAEPSPQPRPAERAGRSERRAAHRMRHPAAQPFVASVSEPALDLDASPLPEAIRPARRRSRPERRRHAEPSPRRAAPAARRRLAVAGAALVLLAAAAAAGLWGYRHYVLDGHRVPALGGDSLVTARQAAARQGLDVRVAGRRYSSSAPAGEVMGQSPAPGSRLRAGSVLALELSLGRAPVALPTGLVGERGPEVVAKLRSVHLKVAVSRAYADTVGPGRVAEVSPSSGSLPYGSLVHVIVSRGPALVTIPPIPAGAGWSATEQALRSLHLRPAEQLAWSSTYSAGEVLSLSPAPGTARVRAGETVVVVVSRGPAPVTIPTVPAAATWTQYGDILVALGLKPVEQLAYDDSVPAGQVVSSSPAAGATGVAVGSTVEVIVSRGPVLVAVPNVAGEPIGQAVAAIEAQGLTVSEQIGPPLATKATTTEPAAGSDVREGSSVTLYVA